MLKKIILVFLLTFTSVALFAEGNNTNANSAQTQKEDSKANLEAAYKLLDEMNLKKVYESAVNNSTQRLIQANKNFKSIEDKIKAFYQKYIGWDSVKEDLAKLYSKYYTPKELEDITNFYKTPTGKKVLATMGKLAYEGQLITQKRLRPHLNELKKILDDAMEKAKKEEPKDSNKTTAKEDKK
jgi:hypothetical protein